MKKFLAILICLVLVFCGCSSNQPQETTQTPTTAPPTTQIPTTEPTTEPTTQPTETEPPVPETISATALVDHIDVVLTVASRDATVDIVDEFDEDYYVVQVEQGYGLLEKRLVRMEGAEAYTPWTGYAVYQAKVYNNYHLLPGGEKNLNMNTPVEVLEDLDGCLVVRVDNAIGYMPAKQVSRSYINPAPSNPGSADGGDIELNAQGGVVLLSVFAPQGGNVTGKATVLVDNAEILLGWFDSEDQVLIVNEEGFVEEKEGWYAIYHEGFYGYVRQNLIRREGEDTYEQWDGFAKYLAKLYDNYYLNGEAVKQLNTNSNIRILCDLGSCYLVTSGDHTGYIAKDMVSKTYIPSSSGGNNNDSGGDWTPPAM